MNFHYHFPFTIHPVCRVDSSGSRMTAQTEKCTVARMTRNKSRRCTEINGHGFGSRQLGRRTQEKKECPLLVESGTTHILMYMSYISMCMIYINIICKDTIHIHIWNALHCTVQVCICVHLYIYIYRYTPDCILCSSKWLL